MNPNSQLEQLTRAMTQLVKESSERSTRLEVQQENLTKNQDSLILSVERMSEASRIAIESNTRLEAKIESLEERALDKMTLVEDSVNDMSIRVDDNVNDMKIIDKRTHALELINANEAGMQEQLKKNNEHWVGRYTRILGTIGVLLTASGLIYTIFFATTKVTG